MQSRLFHSLSRILVAGCVLGLGASGLYGQNSSSLPSAPGEAPLSRVDIFTGYSYAAPKATVKTPLGTAGDFFYQKPSAINAGVVASGAYYFNRYVGGQLEYGNHREGGNDGYQDILGGIIFRFPFQKDAIIPFVHALAGVAQFGGPNDEPIAYHPYTWGPALEAGGGMDYDTPWFNHHLGIRLFQVDYQYIHVNFGPQPITGGRLNAGVAQLSTGLVFKFGNLVPPPPVTYACSANPASVFPGEPVTITGTATNLDPKKKAFYSWSGEGATGTDSTATVQTGNLAPGTYHVSGHVTEGKKVGQSADCAATFTVKHFEPPTVSCTASPTTVNPGDSSTITATGVSPQNRPLTYSYQASAGSISGTGTTATLSTTGAPAGTITVTCNVSDDKGQTASSTTTVDVSAPPPPPAPKVQTLCSIQFNHDKRRPTRVDNDAKACLDDVALNLQRQADATLVVVGNSAPVRQTRSNRRHHVTAERQAAERAVNTKEYLVREKGIDPSRISVRTDNTGSNEVENYLVPSGANFENDVQGTTPVNEATVKAKPRTTRHHRARHHRTTHTK